MRIDLVPAVRIFGASFLLAALASCGGGGGGGGGGSGPMPTVPLTATNAQAVSGNVALASAQLAQRVQKNDFFLPLDAQASSTQRSAFGLTRFLAQEITRISEQH